MTYSGLFEEGNEIRKLKEKIKELKTKIKNLEGLEDIHRNNNGYLRAHITKLEKEIYQLKKTHYLLKKEKILLKMVLLKLLL